MTVIAIAAAAGNRPAQNIDSDSPSGQTQSRIDGGKAALRAGRLVQGQVIHGRVTKLLPDMQALVRILGSEAKLSLPFPQPVGANIAFSVLKTGTEVELKLLEESLPQQPQKAKSELSSAKTGQTGAEANKTEPLLEKGALVRARVNHLNSRNEAVIEWRGREVPVILTRAVPPGRHYSFRVDRAGNEIMLTPVREQVPDAKAEVSAAKVGRGGEETNKAGPLLEKGALVRARLNHLNSRNEAVIEWRGREVPVILTRAVPPGRHYSFRVDRAGNEMVLTPVREQVREVETMPGSLLQRLEARTPLGEGWERLHAALGPLIEKEDASHLRPQILPLLKALEQAVYDVKNGKDTDFFRTFLNRTGQTLENSLYQLLTRNQQPESDRGVAQDNLKSLLLNFIQSSSDGRDVDSSALQRAFSSASALLDSVETGQVLNNLTSAKEGAMFFQVPFALREHVSTGYLSLKFDFKGRNRSKGPREILTVFFLDLTALGGIRVDAGLTGGERVRVSVMVEKEETLPFVRLNLPHLTQRLAAHDLNVESVQAVAAPRNKLEEGCREDLRAGMIEARIHVVV